MPEGLFSLSKMRLGKHRGWSHRRTGVARYLPGCVLQAIVALTRPTHKTLGSIDISILPPELLHIIFELLALPDHNTLLTCMQVCRRWHDIAHRHFFAVVPVGYFDIDRFSQLLRTDSGLRARHVKEIHFIDEWCQGTHSFRYSQDNSGLAVFHHPLDVRLLASTLPALGLVNLQYLSLVGFDNLNHRPPSLNSVRQSQAQGQKNNPSPTVSLRQLTCDECLGLTLILPSLLSLFSVDTLVIRVHPREPATSPWDMSTVHSSRISPASITIQNLVFEGNGTGYTEHNYYQFFERILAPGSLRMLGAWAGNLYSYDAQLPRFIRCDAAKNLLSISIDVSGLTGMETSYLTECFKTLGNALAHCTRLECFRIRCIHAPYNEYYWNHCGRPTTFAPILENLPRTLRVFAIYVEVRNWWFGKDFRGSSAGLAYVDRVLTPPRPGAGGGETRFPHLERVELNVCEESFRGRSRRTRKPKPIKEPLKSTPLPRLEAAGLLRLRVVHEDAVPRAIADFYLPPEMERV